MLPRCGKPLRCYSLAARVRDYEFGLADPVCGLPAGHERYTNCKSEEVLERWRRWRREKYARH